MERMIEIDRAKERCRRWYPERFLPEPSPCEFIKRGQLHWRSKLTNREIELIRELHETGMGVIAIAKKFGVSKSHISRVTRYHARSIS